MPAKKPSKPSRVPLTPEEEEREELLEERGRKGSKPPLIHHMGTYTKKPKPAKPAPAKPEQYPAAFMDAIRKSLETPKPDKAGELQEQSELFTKLIRVVERRAHLAGVSPQEYVTDVLLGKREQIDPSELDDDLMN